LGDNDASQLELVACLHLASMATFAEKERVGESGRKGLSVALVDFKRIAI